MSDRTTWAGILLLSLLLSSTASAQEPVSQVKARRNTSPKNVISVIPVIGFGAEGDEAFVFGDMGARFNHEYLFDRHHGLFSEIGFYAHRLHFEETGFIRSFGFDAAMGYRWHWKGSASSGFYGVHAGMRVIGPELDHTNAPYLSLFIAGNLGYRWWWKNGFTITLRGGPGYQQGLEEGNPFGDRFYFDLETSVGLWF